jgi:hypothetical protein
MAAFVVSEFEALDEGAPAHYQQLAAALIAANGGQLRENLPLSNCTRDWKSHVQSRQVPKGLQTSGPFEFRSRPAPGPLPTKSAF